MQDGVEIIHQGQVALIMLSGAFSPALKITDAPWRIIGLGGSGGKRRAFSDAASPDATRRGFWIFAADELEVN